MKLRAILNKYSHKAFLSNKEANRLRKRISLRFINKLIERSDKHSMMSSMLLFLGSNNDICGYSAPILTQKQLDKIWISASKELKNELVSWGRVTDIKVSSSLIEKDWKYISPQMREEAIQVFKILLPIIDPTEEEQFLQRFSF